MPLEKLSVKNWLAIAGLYFFGAFAIVGSSMEVPRADEQMAVFFLPGTDNISAARKLDAALITIGINRQIQVLSFSRDVSLSELWDAGAILSVNLNTLLGCGFVSADEMQTAGLLAATES